MDFITIGNKVIPVEQEEREEFPFPCICAECDQKFYAVVPDADLCGDCEYALRNPGQRK